MEEVIKFLPVQIVTVNAMLAYTYSIIYFGDELIETMKHSLKPIGEASEKTIPRIKKEIKYIKMFMIIPLVAVVASLTGFGTYKKIHFVIMYINQRYERVLLLQMIYLFCLSYSCVTVTSIHYYWLYYIFHIKFQLYILRENVRELMTERDMFYDDAYQNEIYDKLIKCVQHHQDMKRCHAVFNHTVYWGLLLGQGAAIGVITISVIFIIRVSIFVTEYVNNTLEDQIDS
ncbi:uncharacterized protein LOC108908828 [Anoplophora glabripennis]|uniref:uncharacterized protein LOC108908828 n=1 Tax=Anoplophora glabripennis TaxID=217634 RepID=UPI000873DF43|nr:uncharacterized protein LOC108908828 [Anoplophora glabripennis]